MIFVLPVYMRAILKAASLASVPEVVKKNLLNPFGSISTKSCDSSARAVGGIARHGIAQLLRLRRNGVDNRLVLMTKI